MNWEMEFANAIYDGSPYDFICNHYWEISKEDLKNILLECIYALNNNNTWGSIIDELETQYKGVN